MKIRAYIKETENRKTTEKINEAKVFFGKLNKIDKPLPRLTKIKKKQHFISF